MASFTEDDNILINKETLYKSTNKWNNLEILKCLENEMKVLCSLRFSKNYFSETLLKQALDEIIGQLGWTDYTIYKNMIKKLLRRQIKIPFSMVTRDNKTKQNNFWLMRNFVVIKKDNVALTYTDDNGDNISKLKVLMSGDFANYLRNYCKKEFNDEVHVLIYAGLFKGKQHLDLTRFKKEDLDTLEEKNGNNLVMIQFKKKVQEEMVGVAVGKN